MTTRNRGQSPTLFLSQISAILHTCHMAKYMLKLSCGDERMFHDGRGIAALASRAGLEYVPTNARYAGLSLRSKVERGRSVHHATSQSRYLDQRAGVRQTGTTQTEDKKIVGQRLHNLSVATMHRDEFTGRFDAPLVHATVVYSIANFGELCKGSSLEQTMTNIIPMLPYLPSLFPFFFFLFRRATRGYTIHHHVDCEA